MSRHIRVKISYNSGKLRPLAVVVDEATRGDNVEIEHRRLAIKALLPFSILVEGVTFYLFEKFVLEPLVGPYAEKWAEKVRNHLEPNRPLNIVVRFEKNRPMIECFIVADEKMKERVWEWIREGLFIFRNDGLWDVLSKVRFFTDDGKEVKMIGYVGEKPVYTIDWERREVTEIK